MGFDVNMVVPATTSDQINTIMAKQDYDIAWWGLNIRDSDPLPKLFSAMHSGGKQVYGMYTSAEMDNLIDKFQTETDEDAKKAILGDVQRQVNEDVPFMNFGAGAECVAWQDNLHGVKGSSNSLVLLGEAWKN